MPDHQRQPHQPGRDIGLQHRTVLGNDRDAALLLPERKRLPLRETHLQLARIEFQHRRVGNPGIGAQPLAHGRNIKEEE